MWASAVSGISTRREPSWSSRLPPAARWAFAGRAAEEVFSGGVAGDIDNSVLRSPGQQHKLGGGRSAADRRSCKMRLCWVRRSSPTAGARRWKGGETGAVLGSVPGPGGLKGAGIRCSAGTSLVGVAQQVHGNVSGFNVGVQDTLISVYHIHV